MAKTIAVYWFAKIGASGKTAKKKKRHLLSIKILNLLSHLNSSLHSETEGWKEEADTTENHFSFLFSFLLPQSFPPSHSSDHALNNTKDGNNTETSDCIKMGAANCTMLKRSVIDMQFKVP